MKRLLVVVAMVGSMGSVAQQVTPSTETTTPAISDVQSDSLMKHIGDWAQLGRYRADNASLPPVKAGEKRVVFYGDSITDGWGRHKDADPWFPGKSYVNRGISGQTTAQMLVRFQQDVVALHPAAVILLAGTNDIAGNTGPASIAMIADNITSMADIAKAHGIRMILTSVLPADHYNWRKDAKPAESIKALNVWIKSFAAARGLVYVDYYSALVNGQGGLDEVNARDGVHPTKVAYAVMAPLAEAGIEKALKKKP